MQVQQWIELARASGFTEVSPLDTATLRPMEMVRSACSADRCRSYAKNWSCPPFCGSLAQCARQLQQYPRGLLLQTVGKLEKTIDTKGYARIEAEHRQRFYGFCDQLRKVYPHALCLGSGVCRVCTCCAWPEPCRFPEQRICSMEAYGLFVTQVCRDNQCAYHHGERTVTYTACVLF